MMDTMKEIQNSLFLAESHTLDEQSPFEISIEYQPLSLASNDSFLVILKS